MSSRVHGGLLVALAWGVYAIGIQAPFLLDDNVFITNPTSGIGDLWSFDDYRNRPVMMLSLSLNYAIAGAEPAGGGLAVILKGPKTPHWSCGCGQDGNWRSA